jgi:uncharacterized protein with NRDE domain
MCLIALGVRVLTEWPLVVAANRDEYYDRPSSPPQLLAKAPQVVGGRDVRAGGTWLGINEHGVVFAIANRATAQGERPDRPSRGRLCLEALHWPSGIEAVKHVADLAARETFNAFNVIAADRTGAWLVSNVDP